MADQPPPYTALKSEPGYQAQQPGYPPQQAGYPPPQPVYPAPQPTYPIPVQPPPQGAMQTAQAVIVQQPSTVVMSFATGPLPMMMQCPYCRATITTCITYREGTLTWLLVLGMALFLIWPFCLIPFCIDGCKDVHHSCPNCRQQIAVYRRM